MFWMSVLPLATDLMMMNTQFGAAKSNDLSKEKNEDDDEDDD